ncbi:MAG: hypothetical protein QM802_09220 [Agriterribacter sp.]
MQNTTGKATIRTLSVISEVVFLSKESPRKSNMNRFVKNLLEMPFASSIKMINDKGISAKPILD